MLKTVNIHKLNGTDIPECLRRIDSPPKQLFYKGIELDDWMNLPKLGIVGSRKMSGYGAYVTELLASAAAQAGVVVISGLAYGVDGAAQKAALLAGGVVVAVLPTPIESIYPDTHLNLANQIAGNGGLVSEYPADAAIYKTNFVARNRLIAGLSDALLIPEAALKSGSLHTARFALNQGKTVMAVPGNINSPGSEGCNNLIKSGAIPVTKPEDVLAAMNISSQKRQRPLLVGSREEQQLYELIRAGVQDQDELAARAGLDAAQFAGALTGLEINGFIRPLGAGQWTI